MFFRGLYTTKSANEAHKSEPVKLQHQAARDLLNLCTLVGDLLVTARVVVFGWKSTTVKNLQVCSISSKTHLRITPPWMRRNCFSTDSDLLVVPQSVDY